jgi:hypothetical protein
MVYTSTVKYIRDEGIFADGLDESFSVVLGQAVAKIDPENPTYNRGCRDFSQSEYKFPAPPVFLGTFDVQPPEGNIYALRLLLKQPGSGYVLPRRLSFLKEYIRYCATYQASYFPAYDERFVYLTLRSGEVLSNRDDEFHADGFQGISVPRHIPEQNYLWTDSYPTLFSMQPYFVEDLDPALHNFHSYFDNHTYRRNLYSGVERGLYIVDPFHIHARQKVLQTTRRTLIRLTFSPVEIRDDTNTVNPWLPRGPYNREDIRNILSAYDGGDTAAPLGLRRFSEDT